MTIAINDTLQLALIAPAHAQPLYELVEANRAHLRTWLPWVDNMQGPGFIQQFVANCQRQYVQGSDHAFVIVENGQLVGRIGIYKIDQGNRIGEIGYWVAEAAQGRGIITQACRAIIGYGFNDLQLNRIEIKCAAENTKSQAVPERLGFEKEGILRQAERLHGRFVDLVLYAKVKGDGPI
jgi:ribosomal-protein-serine acetyltransferase